MARKRLFCKVDCSQAYHSLQMANQRSNEMLAFKCAIRTFSYRRLAQGLSRALSAFWSFMREYLDKVIKAAQCAQYVDDIGIVANNATQLINNLRATFECVRTAGLKLTMHKCHFGAKKMTSWGVPSLLKEYMHNTTQGPKLPRENNNFKIQKSTSKILGFPELRS